MATNTQTDGGLWIWLLNHGLEYPEWCTDNVIQFRKKSKSINYWITNIQNMLRPREGKRESKRESKRA